MLLARALLGDTWCLGEIVGDRFFVIVGDIFGEHRRDGQSLPMEDVVLGAPLDGVRFVSIMAGFNPPEGPPLDLPLIGSPKACNFATGDGGEIQMPSILTGALQIESELAVVVGRMLRKASPSDARDAIFGWSVFNDVTAPEYGEVGYWALAKSFDGFASWGPWIRRDLTEERVLEGLAITSSVNGTQAQSGNTKYYRFSPSKVLSHISHQITLYPGDVVALGTPFPPAEAKIGDHTVCEVEEVGMLNNYIVPETIDPPSPMPRRPKAAVSPTGVGDENT